MSEDTDERISRIEARRKRREQRRLSLDTDEENKPVNGVDEDAGGGRSRSSTTDSDAELSRALTREEKRQERREKKRQREMAEKSKESAKSAAVITDFSKREIRERRPSDPEILSGDSESVDDTDKENEQRNAQREGERKKSGYGSYASAIRRGSQGTDIDKRKERYAAATEGYNINVDDDDDGIDLSPHDPSREQQPEVMSTSPVRRIKEDYLTSASGAGREVPHSEEQPTPHHLNKQWPPPPSEDDEEEEREEERRKGVVKTFEEPEPSERDRGVDEGHVDSVSSLKEQWQWKEQSKPLGVNKPYVPMKRDDVWITHFRPVIDEGETPKEPAWLQMVRQRRWKSTVSARFPQTEEEKQVFEHRSTTPRKFKKPNPYSLMRSKSDLDDEFEIAMRRRRRKTDDEDSVDASKRSWSSLTDADQDSVAVLSKVPLKGPLKEYKKNLALERARGTMLKWTFSTDMVDDPLRFDLPKPIDLTTQEDYEREQEWKYMQSRKRFLSGSEAEGMGTSSMHSSMSSLSEGEHPKSPVSSTPAQPEQRTSVSSDEIFPSSQEATHSMPVDSGEDVKFSKGVSDIKKNLMDGSQEEPLKSTIADDNLEYVPKLADLRKKLHEREEEPIPKSTHLDEEIQMIPKMKDIKSKYLTPKKDEVSKHPEFEEGEQFERLDSIKNRFQAKEKETEPKVLSRPKLKKKLSTSDDMKAIMASRRQMTDEFVSQSPETAQEIKSLASDIAKTFGSESSDSPKQSAGKKKKEKREKEETKSTESATVSEESDSQQFGPCGKPEGCGTDDELDKRLSKELDILPTLGDELKEEPESVPFKDKVVQDKSAPLESAPQRDSFTDEGDSVVSGDDKVIKKQESMDTVETSDKESDTESEAEIDAKKQVEDDDDDKSDNDDDEQDFLSSESETEEEEELDREDGKPDELDQGAEKVDGNTKSRLSTDRPLSYTLDDVRTRKLIKEDEERPKSFTFGEDESTEDPFISSKYVGHAISTCIS